MDENKVVFKRTIVPRGTGSAVQLPKELVDFLDLKIDEEVSLLAETGKHGKFLALWKTEDIKSR